MFCHWNKLQERKRKISYQTGLTGGANFQVVYNTVANLVKNEQEWLTTWICANSDCTPTDLLKCKTADKDSIGKLIQAATQMMLKQTLLPEHRVKDILWAVMNQLHEVFGFRLKDIVKEGFMKEGVIDYLGISCYDLLSNEDGLITKLNYQEVESCVAIAEAKFNTDFGV